MKKRILGNEKGQALILVIGILAIVALLTSAALVYSKGQSFNAIRQKKQMQAYYIADAGITKAIEKIKSNPDTYLQKTNNFDNLNNQNYGGGKIISLTLSDPDNEVYTLTSIGKYPNPDDHLSAEPSFLSTKTIEAKIKWVPGGTIPPGGGVQPGGESYFGKGIWTNQLTVNNAGRFESSVYCTGNVVVNNSLWIGKDNEPRDIHANGNITLNNACKIWGDIFAKGIINLRNGDSVSKKIQSLSDIELGNGNEVKNAVLSHGNINITNGSKFNQLQANGKITLGNGVMVNDMVKAGNDLYLDNGNKVNASVWTMGNLTMINGNTIEGSAWVHGTHSLGNGGNIKGGIFHLESLEPLQLNIPEVPPVPLPDLNWYKTEAQKTPGHYFEGNQELKLEDLGSGVYFINGNLEIPSFWSKETFSGKATIVASGNINMPNGKDINLNDVNNDSLLLIAGNNIELVNGNKINAFLWAGNKVTLNNANTVKGGIVSPNIEARNASKIQQVELPSNNVIQVVSWQ